MPLKLFQRGEVWHYRGTVAGRRLRNTTGSTDKKLAQRIAAQVEADAWRGLLDGPGKVTFAQAAIAYRQSEKSTRFLEKIEDHWKDTPLRKITGEAVRLSAKELYPEAKPATWNRQVIVPTAAIINYAAELGWASPIKIKRFPVNAKKKTPATLEWVNAFAAQAVEDGLPHLAALALFMFGTGARVGEATAMTWADVDLSKRAATIRQTKIEKTARDGDTARTAHLQGAVFDAIANIPSNRRPGDKVFGYAGAASVKKVWRAVAERAGIEPLTPHCCRHGFATAMLRKGMDVATVAKMGGWKDTATVLRTYAHALEDRTVTDAIFDTKSAHGAISDNATDGKERKKLA